MVVNPLKDFGETAAHLISDEAEKVDHERVARQLGKIASVAILADVAFQSRDTTKAKLRSLLARNNEARTVELHARAAQVLVGEQRHSGADIRADREVRVNVP